MAAPALSCRVGRVRDRLGSHHALPGGIANPSRSVRVDVMGAYGVSRRSWCAASLSAKRSGAAMYAACFSRRGLPRRNSAAVAARPDVIR